MNKVLLLNGSPHQFGCTHTALREVSDALEDSGIATEILHIGGLNIPGCKACDYCHRTGQCIMDELRKADKVAYVRFASVYRNFQDIETFSAEIDKLKEDQPQE